MTTITIDRAVVEQALEALESVDWYLNQLEEIVYSADDAGTHEERAKAQPAIAALRAALAQQAEPVEPVAWGVDWGRDGDRACASIVKKRADGSVEIVAVEYAPYTAPPQRKPLTDEEIKECLPPDAVRLPPGWAQFARAVERKVRGEEK